MATIVNSRIQIKQSTVPSQEPTIPASNDHTDGSWLITDIYEGEFFWNIPDKKLYQRSGSSIVQIMDEDSIASILGDYYAKSETDDLLDEKLSKPIVISANKTAVLDEVYHNVASATYTDPTPVEGKGFTVFVRNGTATVGGTAYATVGTIIVRTYHSGSWSNYVYTIDSVGTVTPVNTAITNNISLNELASRTQGQIDARLIGDYLTTTQRLALNPSASAELLIFDTDLNILFAWKTSDWIPIGSIIQQDPNLEFPAIPTTPTNYPVFNVGATTDNVTTPIVYQSSDTSKATVDSSGNVTLIGTTGSVTITASQASGNGYQGAQVSRAFTIVEPTFDSVTTDVSLTPTTVLKTIATRSNYLAIYIPEHSSSTEKHGLINPRFNIAVKIGATTHTVEVDFLSKYVFKVNAGDTISIGASIARSFVISEGWSNNIETSTLRTVTGTALTQATDIASVGTITMPLFNSPATHITLPFGSRLIRFNSNSTEKYQVLYKEYNGTTWSPTQKVTVPKTGNITIETTQRKICFATTNGANININVPSTTVVDRNTSVERRYTLPTVTGTQHQVSSVAELTAACAAAVAGDEILLLYSGSPYTGVTINTSAFTANIAAGNKGAEGIIIRGQIVGGNKPIIQPTRLTAENNGAISIKNGDATLFTYIKDLQLDSTGGGCFQWVGGKWMTINVDGGGVDAGAIDGDVMITAVGNTAKITESYYFDCDLADAYADIFNFNGNIASGPNITITANSKVEIHNCTSQRAGGFSNSQCMTTHAQLDVFSVGSLYSDAFLDAVGHETSNDSISWHLFDRITMGARKSGVYQANMYDCLQDNTANMGNIKGANPYYYNNTIYWRSGAPSYGTFRSAICAQEGNIMIREAGTAQMVFSSGSSSRVISKKSLFHSATTSAALQVSNFAGPSNNNLDAIGNTFFGCTKAMSAFDSFNTLRFGNNACIQNGASVADVPASPNNRCVSLGNNVCDPTFDTDAQTTGSDITNADAQVDTTYFRPTASGNCDNGEGLYTLYNAIGGRDPYGIVHIMSSTLTPRGAFARLNTSGVIVPELYN